MYRCRIAWTVLFAFAATLPLLARAGDFRIHYAEPVEILFQPVAGASGAKPALQTHLSFDAFGRRFDASLESNQRLLSRLTRERRAAFAGYEVYRGTLDGLPDTWVRLTRVEGRYSGALWDGRDLYVLDSLELAAPFMVHAPVAAPHATIVYRASDVHSIGTTPRYDFGSPAPKATALDAYQSVVADLREASVQAASGGLLQVEVAVLADSELANAFADTAGAMLARMNIVDGIFTEQVGVTVLPTDFRVLTGAGDPFRSTDPSLLLSQVAQYRKNTPVIRDRGLAHLMTGKTLADDTLGIAYLDVLCDPEVGVSLSEGWHDQMTSALIAAHELGHNFGAPHDGEPGACATTPQVYLMAPYFSYSDQFSACSLAQMQPAIDAAACVTPAPYADLALEAPAESISGSAGEPFDITIDIRSAGTATATAVVAFIQQAPLEVQSAVVEGGTCTLGNQVRCELGDMPAGDLRRITLTVVTAQSGTYPTSVRVISVDDVDLSNNDITIDAVVDAPYDIAVSFVDPPAEAFTRDVVDIDVLIESVGTRDVDDVVLHVVLGFDVISASVDGRECTWQTGEQVDCAIGAMPAGTSHTAHIAAMHDVPGLRKLFARFDASRDGNAFNDYAYADLNITSAVDVAARIDGPYLAQVGTPYAFAVEVSSVGVRAAEGATVRIAAFDADSLEVIDEAGGSCAVLGQIADCLFDRLDPGAVRRLAARATYGVARNYTLQVTAGAGLDDNVGNDTDFRSIDVRPSVNVGISNVTTGLVAEGRASRMTIDIDNIGLSAATDVHVEIALPDGVHGAAASFGNGTCTIAAGSIECVLPKLAALRTLPLLADVVPDAPGSYTGMIRVTAPGDPDPGNDTRMWSFTAVPNIDVALIATPTAISAALDEEFEVPVRIVTDRQPVRDVVLAYSGYPSPIETSAPGWVCKRGNNNQLCSFGDLPAFSSIDVVVHYRSADVFRGELGLEVRSAGDIDRSNNFAKIAAQVGNIGDVRIETASDRVEGRVGQDFELPAITLTGIRTMDQVAIRILLPGVLYEVSVDMPGATCETGSSIVCRLRTVAAGSSTTLKLTVHADEPFATVLRVQALQPYDENPDDNQVEIEVAVSEAPPPAGGGGGSGGGSGGGGASGSGGGGSFDWLTLLGALVLLAGRSMNRARVHALCAALFVGAVQAAPPPPSAFGQLPAMRLVQLSPDGKSLAWQQTEGENTAIVILDLSTEKPRRIVRWENGLTLRSIQWADDDTLLYDLSLTHSMRLNSGRFTDEFYRTLAINADRGDARVLLMQGNRSWVTGSHLLATETGTPHTVLMETWDYSASAGNSSLGTRLAGGRKDSSWISTVFAVDTHTGRATIVDRGTPFTSDWLVDTRGHTVARSEWIATDRRLSVLVRDGKAWRTVYSSSAGPWLSLEGLTADGESLVVLGALDGTRVKVWGIPLDDGGSPVVLFEEPDADVGWILRNPYTRQPVGYALDGIAPQVHWIDETWESRHKALARKFGGNTVDFVSQSRDGQRVVVRVSGPSQPAVYYLVRYDRSSAMTLGEAYPQLVDVPLGEVRSIHYAARDGTDIPAYLTLPAQGGSTRLPLVVLPHGGPESHDDYTFDWWAQFLASRGYAVLQPQFRGSTGFGEAHRLAGRHEWGRRMQDDVTDGVAALVKDGVANEQCVCVVGASYGGYVALAGAAFTPDVYRCAASISGVSDLQAMLAFERTQTGDESNTLAYWKDQLGSATDPELARISPVHSAANVKAAVLIMHGSEDTIVPVKQSEAMAKALDAAGKRYRFVKLPGEDHWLSAGSTRTQMLTELESFLDENLGSACGKGGQDE